MTTHGALNNLLQMTVYNPLFAFIAITFIWFLPGILVRRIAEKRYKATKAEKQAKAQQSAAEAGAAATGAGAAGVRPARGKHHELVSTLVARGDVGLSVFDEGSASAVAGRGRPSSSGEERGSSSCRVASCAS